MSKHYVIGGYCGGSLYHYAGMGDFSTPEAAADYWYSKPRSGAAVLVEQRDAVKNGVVYGTHVRVLPMPDAPQ